MTEREVEQFEIPTGCPLVVEFAPDLSLQQRYYLDTPAAPPLNSASG